MANTGVKGQVVNEAGVGIPGVRVAAYDKDGLFGDNFLNASIADVGGNFALSYPAGAYGLEVNPDLVVRVYDKVKRLLFESPVHEDFGDAVLDVGQIVITDVALGLAVTQGGGGPNLKSSGNIIEFLIDDQGAWSKVTDAIHGAQKSIHLSQLYFDVTAATDANGPRLITKFLDMAAPIEHVRLEQELSDAKARGVAVRVLLNDLRWFHPSPMPAIERFPPYPFDTAGHMDDYLETLPEGSRFEYRRSPPTLGTATHAKILIIDGNEAYIIGSPLLQEYFDDDAHAIDNPRRGWMNTANQIKVPIHDVNCRIRGPAVADLDKTFCLLWNEEGSEGEPILNPVDPPPPEPGGIQLQVIRSLPGETRYEKVPKGEDGIYEGYLRAFARATDFIYLENQYLTCDELFDALILAMQAQKDLQLIMVFNSKIDVWIYPWWQDAILDRLLRALPPAERGRIGFFTLWTHEPALVAGGKTHILRNYVHSKVAVVDDCWATTGSANLDSTGLTATDFNFLANVIANLVTDGVGLVSSFIEHGVLDFKSRRSVEVNVGLFNDDFSPLPAASVLRRILWAEHFGLRSATPPHAPNPEDPMLTTRPAGGWLSLWRSLAEAKRDGLKGDPGTVANARMLPYPRTDDEVPANASNPIKYLTKHLGVDAGKIGIQKEIRSFSFSKGNWID